MSEIKVGEYVRTDEGIIGKIKRIELDKNDISLKWYVFDRKRPDMNIVNELYINKPYIVKHSKNIIDLIEEGDYVNGYELSEFDDEEGNLYLGIPIYDDALMDSFTEIRSLSTIEIKSIVTKEQFQKIEYGGTI